VKGRGHQDVYLVLVWAAVLGCRETPPAVEEEHQKTSTVAEVNVSRLPAVGETMEPLDDGRVRLAPPEGWCIVPRSRKWVVRFQQSPGARYPAIILTAEDYETVFQVTRENVGIFAGQRSVALEPRGAAALKVTLVAVGRWVGVSYLRHGEFDHDVLDRLMMETVVAGRKYNLELRTLEGASQASRPLLLAVAAAMEFPQQTASHPTAATTVEPFNSQ